MATIAALVAESTSGNSTTYTSATFTPDNQDLLFVFSMATATVGVEALSASNGLAWTQETLQTKNASADRVTVWIANAVVTTSAGITVSSTYGTDAATGHIFFVGAARGLTIVSTAIRQTGGQSNQAAGTPAPTFPMAVLSSNPAIGCVFNATNPATMTPPAGWTENADIGFAAPVAGGEWVSINSGFTGTTVTWGSASASAFADIVAEFDTSTGASAAATRGFQSFALLGVGV